MASKNTCSTCLRALRQQSRQQTHTPALNRLPLPQSIQHTRSYATPKPTVVKPQAPPPPASFDPPPLSEAIARSEKHFARLRGSALFADYLAFQTTEELFLECSRQCSYTMPSAISTPPTEPPQNAAGEHIGEGEGFWLTPKSKGGLGLDVTFQNWAQVMYLHMWMLTVRFRAFPKEHVKPWDQQLLDHCMYAQEDRMAMWHGMVSGSARNKNLKEQWLIWRGTVLGYDEGLIKGDAAMAGAIWRSIFKSNPEVDVSDVALVTAYVMRELQMLGKVLDSEICQGQVKFGDIKTVERTLLIESRSMRQPVTERELKEAEAAVK